MSVLRADTVTAYYRIFSETFTQEDNNSDSSISFSSTPGSTWPETIPGEDMQTYQKIYFILADHNTVGAQVVNRR